MSLLIRGCVSLIVMSAMLYSLFMAFSILVLESEVTLTDSYIMGIATCAWLALLARGEKPNGKKREG